MTEDESGLRRICEPGTGRGNARRGLTQGSVRRLMRMMPLGS